MDKLKINDNGVIKKIEYTDKYGTGIFLAKGSKVVKQNCKELNIRLDENLELYLKSAEKSLFFPKNIFCNFRLNL